MLVAIFSVIVAIVLIVIGVKLYLIPPTRWCRSHRCLIGKTVLITGGNTGIGYETALDFAKRGAKVILGCRDGKKAEQARLQIIEETDNPNIFVKIIDMSSFASVRSFARNMYETENRLDILVNNAGICFSHGEKSEDGFELVMQVNYYSHFLLTNLLIKLMMKSNEPSRIINTSSLAAVFVLFFDVNKLNIWQGDVAAYNNSKLCNILFTKELAKRLKNTKITTYSLHPGCIKTRIFRNARGLETWIIRPIVELFYKDEGAQTTIYCAVEKNIEKFSGHHFDNCRRSLDYWAARKPGLPRELWKFTEEILQLKEEDKF